MEAGEARGDHDYRRAQPGRSAHKKLVGLKNPPPRVFMCVPGDDRNVLTVCNGEASEVILRPFPRRLAVSRVVSFQHVGGLSAARAVQPVAWLLATILSSFCPGQRHG